NVFDSKGEKMSKSKGNIVVPTDIVEKYGADSLRLWCISSSIHDDLPLREQELTRGRRTVIKLYNSMKLVSSLENGEWDGKIMMPFNRWILGEFSRTLAKVQDSYDRYDLAKARNEIDGLFWRLFCDNYLEMIKHYSLNGDSRTKGEIREVATRVGLGILKMYAPVAPFITEEAFHMLGMDGSVHQEKWPEAKEFGDHDPEKFTSVLQAIEGIRAERSKLKSARENYTGFTITMNRIPDPKEQEIISNTLRETGLKFVEGGNFSVQAFI
ncbi:MAG: class I tRNA ligase family protein, partial [Candidatus Thermoplasmatota archaeon]|nr:class I tRNA ligase family protein [Candidatus Thermoplasmatota archaeon]